MKNYELYSNPTLPVHWVVKDRENSWWIVPAYLNGWRDKRPYKGNYSLERAPEYSLAILRLPE